MPYTPQDIHIDDSNALDMGTSLVVGDLVTPTVIITNSAHRWIYVGVDPLDDSSFELGPIRYLSTPPSAYFNATSMIAGAKGLKLLNILPTLMAGSLSSGSEELPLPMPYSKFRVRVIGPAWDPSVLASEDLVGRNRAWAMNIVNVWLGVVAGSLAQWKSAQEAANMVVLWPVAEAPSNPGFYSTELGEALMNAPDSLTAITPAYVFLINTVEQIVENVFGPQGSPNPSVALPKVAQALSAAMDDQDVAQNIGDIIINYLFAPLGDYVVDVTLKAALKYFPPTAWIGRITFALNTVLTLGDFFELDENGYYTVDIPARRAPQLTAPDTLTVPLGGRVTWPLSVLLPDGRRLSFDSQRFQAVITAVPSASGVQGFVFDNIAVIQGGTFQTLPFRLTLTVSMPSGTIAAINPQPGSLPPPDGAYEFMFGLGPYVQGLAVGQGYLSAELTLDPGSYPYGVGDDRDSTVTASLTVSQPTLSVVFSPHQMDNETGMPLPLPLTVAYSPVPNLVGTNPATAQIVINENATQVTFSQITLDDGTLLPYSLGISSQGTDANGNPLIDFVPPEPLASQILAGPVALQDGLGGIARVRNAGAATIMAVVTLDPDQPQLPPASDVLQVNISLSLIVAVLSPDQLTFDDTIVQGLTVTVEMPDGTDWSTANPLLGNADLTDNGTVQMMDLSELSYQDANGAMAASAVDLQLTIPSGAPVAFDAQDAFETTASPILFSGPLQDFLKAVNNGPTTLTVLPVISSDSAIVYACQSASAALTVAPPAVPSFTSYTELYTNGTTSSAIACSSGSTYQLWRTTKIQVQGSVSNSTPQTTLAVSVNGRQIPSSDVNLAADGTYTATVTGLEVGANTIEVTANKPANFGHPNSVSFTLQGQEPTIALTSTLPASTIDQFTIVVSGSYATEWTVTGSAPGAFAYSTNGTVSSADGSFNQSVSPPNRLTAGATYTFRIGATNALSQPSPQAVGTVAIGAVAIQFEINPGPHQVIVATPQKNPAVSMVTTANSVQIAGGATNIDSGAAISIEVAQPGGPLRPLHSGPGSFVQTVSLPTQGTYKIQVSASNFYDSASVFGEVVQAVPLTTWIITYQLTTTPGEDETVQVTQVDDRGTLTLRPATAVQNQLLTTNNNVATIEFMVFDDDGNEMPDGTPIDVQISGTWTTTLAGTPTAAGHVCGAIPIQFVEQVNPPQPPGSTSFVTLFTDAILLTGWSRQQLLFIQIP